MHVAPGPEARSVSLQPSSFAARVVVEGLPAATLAALIAGRAAGRRAWRPGVILRARLADTPDRDDSGPPQTIALDDGRTLLTSGAAGEVRVEPGHVLGDVLQPLSLNLLLAQQWARAGLVLVHGAAFELDGTGILALGDRGAGKSVLTAAVLAAGGRVVSDDWVMLGSPDGETFRAERLRDFLMFRKSRATQSLLARLDDMPVIEQDDPPKQVFRIERESPRFPATVRIDQIGRASCRERV